MKTRNVRRRQARRYDRYIMKLGCKVSPDAKIWMPTSVFYQLNPEFKPLSYRAKNKPVAPPPEHMEDHIEILVAHALREERRKEDYFLSYKPLGPFRPPIRPITDMSPELDPERIKEMFGG